MAQPCPRDPRSGGGEPLKHIGAQFGSHDVLADRDYNIERDRNLHGALINDIGKSRDFPGAKKPASSSSGWTVVKRQPTAAEGPSTMHQGGRTTAAAIDSANIVTPMQQSRSETAKTQPWHALGQVSEECNTTTRVSEAGQRIETSSLGTCKGSVDTT
jgi:hypothetical protein